MADLSSKTALALKVQSSAGSYSAPSSSADVYPIANLRPGFDSLRTESPEYTGTIHRPGAFINGKTVSLTFNVMLRGPGGSAPPSADAFWPGRILRAAGFTENIVSSAIPSSAEALGAGSTTTAAVLGATAAATANLYRGLALNLAALGSVPRSLAAIMEYTAGKEATLGELLAEAPTGNYQIPRQLAYQLSAGEPSTVLSASFWLGGRRYNAYDMTVSALQLNFPTATREASDYPMLEVTLTGEYQSDADEAAPALTPLGAIPMFKDGDFWVSRKALGGSSFSIDLGLNVGYPPNPNKATGNDTPQITRTQRTVRMTLNQQLKATIDLIALADAQAQHSVWAQYGYTAGNIVSVIVPQARFAHPSLNLGGDFVTTDVEMLIDGADKAINLVFPY